MARHEEAARGSDDDYCALFPTEGHHYTSQSVDASPVRWIDRCTFCGHISSSALRAQLAKGASSTVAAASPLDGTSGEAKGDRQLEKTTERVPSRVQARDEPCADSPNCDLLGHRTEKTIWLNAPVITLQEFDD